MAVGKKQQIALKKYKKEYFKPQHKELIKLAKDFKPWHGDYIEFIIFHMVQMFYDFYKTKDNRSFAQKFKQNKDGELVENTEWFTSMEKCNRMVTKIIDYETDDTEKRKLRKEFYSLIANNIDDWWD